MLRKAHYDLYTFLINAPISSIHKHPQPAHKVQRLAGPSFLTGLGIWMFKYRNKFL